MATSNYIRLKFKMGEKKGTPEGSNSPFLAMGTDDRQGGLHGGYRAPSSEEPTFSLILGSCHLQILNNCRTRGLSFHGIGPHKLCGWTRLQNLAAVPGLSLHASIPISQANDFVPAFPVFLLIINYLPFSINE